MRNGSSHNGKRQRVFNVLSNNTATLHNELWSDNGMGSAVWSNSHGSATYDKPGHHTLSYYLEGGENTQRVTSGGNVSGEPNKLCLMPQEHRSDWSFSTRFQFFHFYFEQSNLQSFAEQVFDKEGRHVELKEITFVDDPFVTQLVRETMLKLNWESATDKLMISHAQQMLLLHLLRQYCQQPIAITPCVGGLSPQNQRRVVDYIEANLMKTFGLGDLASVAQLSEFHFARMFKTSFKCTPHQYVLGRRIELAKYLLLNSQLTLAELALTCGFSSQQHLSAQFKQRVGVTPSVFRKAGT
ncbi:AraC family transcriptional regulator [Vibrio tapetis subsp. quintayensis]|uniref:helix-turn-helix domain-containing protein n=1 Tax=Vibrio tapetis TaxID=52443 RepID=UPI0025B424FC|nr:AraC family transcriptional regulator [Vibrio tapetis]MDN3680229.1 AraC family transcriptional regulator [Vibrio tapetis subsp. quintayensis]